MSCFSETTEHVDRKLEYMVRAKKREQELQEAEEVAQKKARLAQLQIQRRLDEKATLIYNLKQKVKEQLSALPEDAVSDDEE